MKDKLYEYATLFREPGPGAVPTEGLLYCKYERNDFKTPFGYFAYGSAVYNRELTQEEVENFELEYIGVVE